MVEENSVKRRLPAKEKEIGSIQPEFDVRLRLMGTVIDSSPNSVVIDDGTGKVEIFLEKEPSVNQGQLVKVITRIIPTIGGFECRGEALQDMNGFDIDLYKKAKEIANR
ncbi:MAG: hypothetical protein JW700_00435 [Candidatus Aenigmarchaeota archaeon]|nr:hypothetical protein [Candidatus Aenigmarchaeota archaeon]